MDAVVFDLFGTLIAAPTPDERADAASSLAQVIGCEPWQLSATWSKPGASATMAPADRGPHRHTSREHRAWTRRCVGIGRLRAAQARPKRASCRIPRYSGHWSSWPARDCGSACSTTPARRSRPHGPQARTDRVLSPILLVGRWVDMRELPAVTEQAERQCRMPVGWLPPELLDARSRSGHDGH